MLARFAGCALPMPPRPPSPRAGRAAPLVADSRASRASGRADRGEAAVGRRPALRAAGFPGCYAAGVGTLLALAGIVVVIVGALYWLGRDIDPDDRSNPPFDVRRVGG